MTLLERARAGLNASPPECACDLCQLRRFAVAVGEALPGLRREHCDHNDGGDGWGCVSLNWKDKPCDCGADATNAALDGLRAMLEDA